MKTDKPTKEMETLAEAAARLLRRIEQRKKVSGDLERPEQIHVSPAWSRVGESRPGERMRFALKLSRPVVVIRWGEGAQTNVVRLPANGNRYDSALFWEDETIVLDYDEW